MVFFVQGMLQGGDFNLNIVGSLIVLIQNVEIPYRIQHFKPINLRKVALKLIIKTMVNKIKAILGDVVSQNQSNFVPDRQVTNNIIICQEMIRSLRKKQGWKEGMIVKIGLEKAYDRLEWHFIRETL